MSDLRRASDEVFEVESCLRDDLDAHLADGWEPYAVTVEMIPPTSMVQAPQQVIPIMRIYHLRRLTTKGIQELERLDKLNDETSSS